MIKAALVTLGCKLNYAETSTYERGLVAAGWSIVPWSTTDTDLFIVNTCSVTEHSDKKSRNIVRKLHRTSPQAKIIVVGCSAQLRRESYESLDGVIRVFGAGEKAEVVPFAISISAKNKECGIEKNLSHTDLSVNFFRAWSSGERTRSFLKVQDGCDFKCNYCTVPYARGESRNAPIEKILEDAEDIARCGIKEIVLTGVNIGDFGKSSGESFYSLVKALSKVRGIERFRISSIEPNLLTEEIIDWISSDADGKKFLPHFHIPLQSGCDEILSRMGRRYTTADFAGKIEYIRKKLEKPAQQKVFFGIDVIAGFPGETEEMFRKTYSFLKDTVRPAFIHIFPYSKRPGTPAANYPNQVQDSIKTERVERLEALCKELHDDFLKANSGLPSTVLWEQKSADGRFAEGWSENYIRCVRPWKEGIVGTVEKVTLQ